MTRLPARQHGRVKPPVEVATVERPEGIVIGRLGVVLDQETHSLDVGGAVRRDCAATN
jgi:hypothetical protein